MNETLIVSGNSYSDWGRETWNPVTGCTQISPGCKNCYALRIANRLRALGNESYRNGFKVTLHERRLQAPQKWKKPRLVFVNSMGDLFHQEVPVDFIRLVFAIIAEAEQHIFQSLTKRSERLMQIASELEWPDNLWMGVTVESFAYKRRIAHLKTTPAKVKFINFEPLLTDVGEIDLSGIDWVIAGGESGPRARPIRADWVRSIRDQCLASKTPFLFKQWGGTDRRRAGRLLDGKIFSGMPGIFKK